MCVHVCVVTEARERKSGPAVNPTICRRSITASSTPPVPAEPFPTPLSATLASAVKCGVFPPFFHVHTWMEQDRAPQNHPTLRRETFRDLENRVTSLF